MLRHIVTWTLTADDTATKLEHSALIASELQGLVSLIPEISSLTVASNTGPVPGNADVVLIADYADEAALAVYLEHPEHQRVVGVIKPLVASRAAIDFLA